MGPLKWQETIDPGLVLDHMLVEWRHAKPENQNRNAKTPKSFRQESARTFALERHRQEIG